MYASHMDFDSFTHLYVYFDPKHSKGILQPKLKGANVWPFNACGKMATG